MKRDIRFLSLLIFNPCSSSYSLFYPCLYSILVVLLITHEALKHGEAHHVRSNQQDIDKFLQAFPV